MKILASVLMTAMLMPVWALNDSAPLPGAPPVKMAAIEKAPTRPPDAIAPPNEPAPVKETDATAQSKGDTDAAKEGGKRFGPGVTNIQRKKWGQPDIKISMWKYIMSMIMILVLIFGFFFGLRRMSARLGGSGYGSLNVSQRLQLDGKNSLVLVRFHEEELLVAVGPNGTNLISRVASLEESPEADGENGEVAAGTDGLETKHVGNGDSQPFLAKLFGSRSNPGGAQ